MEVLEMSAPYIENYRFGHIVIDGHAHTQDVIILPDRVVGGWWRQEGHVLHPEDLEAVLEAEPDTLVVGQGASGRMKIASETRAALQAAGIALLAHPTGKAVETYNRLRTKRAVAAAFHLSC